MKHPLILLAAFLAAGLLQPAQGQKSEPNSASAASTPAQPPTPQRPQPPTRPFDAPGSPRFERLDGKAGAVPPLDKTGDYVVGPDYLPAPETKPIEGVAEGRLEQFVIDSRDCKRFNPGIARKVFGTVDPQNPKTLIVETHEIDYRRAITVYIPTGVMPEKPVPVLVTHDGPGVGKPDRNLARILDNLIAQKRIPTQVAVMIQNGGGDAQGHERGREYDTLSPLFAEFIEEEVFPRVEKHCAVRITKDPEGRATMGNSSGAAAAFTMAWYRPDLFRRVVSFSGTYVNQQWPFDPATPDGAWGYHSTIIPASQAKPLRVWMCVGDRDSLNPNVMRDNMHDWVEANHRMARVFREKGYKYQYVYCLNAGHGVGNARPQLLPQALEWVWRDYNPR